MVDLISTAYGIEAELVPGGPSWLELDRFDILAKVSSVHLGGYGQTDASARLADRFLFVLHKDSRPLTGFALRSERLDCTN